MSRTPPQLVVAIDVPRSDAIAPLVDRLPQDVTWFKLGLELFCAEGPSALAPLHARGKSVFLDLKLHDIPRTVERAVRSAAQHGAALLTVHACGGRAMIEGASRAAGEFGPSAPKIIAVTVLTSLNDEDLRDTGVLRGAREQALALADLALAAGADGLVCSPHEVAALRARFGAGPLLVVPGIRAGGDAHGDQKRTASASDAVRAGADLLVVGRPILEAPDPAEAARRILRDIRSP